MEEAIYTAYLSSSLKLSSTGEWIHNNNPFLNQNLIQLFHHSIVWDAKEQKYFVQIGKQRASFNCEDTAFFVLALDEVCFPWELEYSTGQKQKLDPKSLRVGSQSQIYCEITLSDGSKHRARFSKTAHQHLAKYVVDSEHISVNNQLIKLKKV